MAKAKITYTCKLCRRSFEPPRTGRIASYCSQRCYHSDERPAIARFWAKVNKSGPIARPELGPCWVWTGFIDKDGYGIIGERAHRKAWRLTYGPLTRGEQVLHRCDNPPCVRPDHLFKGGQNENSADMVAKDRSPWGSRHPNAVLTEDIVRQARALYVPRKFSYRKVAALLGFPEPGIRAAILRVTWTHLE